MIAAPTRLAVGGAEAAITEDRIADIWGARTPFGPDEPWPDRVDESLRKAAANFDEHLTKPTSVGSAAVLDKLRHKASELAGRRPESGLLLLRDLRQLYVLAENANIHWIMLGQVAQALRSHELLSTTSQLHKQTLTQIKWIKTKIKTSTPQTVVAGQSGAQAAAS